MSPSLLQCKVMTTCWECLASCWCWFLGGIVRILCLDYIDFVSFCAKCWSSISGNMLPQKTVEPLMSVLKPFLTTTSVKRTSHHTFGSMSVRSISPLSRSVLWSLTSTFLHYFTQTFALFTRAKACMGPGVATPWAHWVMKVLWCHGFS